VDFQRIHVRGGNGGNGCMSFMQLFANEWAGPDGGDGGNGGHVIFQGKFVTASSTVGRTAVFGRRTDPVLRHRRSFLWG